MQYFCIFNHSERSRQLLESRFLEASVSMALLRVREADDPTGQGGSRFRGTADDQHGVLAGQRPDYLGPALTVQGLSDGLSPAGQGVQHKQLGDPVNTGKQLR